MFDADDRKLIAQWLVLFMVCVIVAIGATLLMGICFRLFLWVVGA